MRGLVQDQIAASSPAAFVVVDELMDAAGILHTKDAARRDAGRRAARRFRQEFAGLVGEIFEYPGAKSEHNPGFQGALEILKHEEFYARLAAGHAVRPDARAFLKARLFDLMIGDWDRHRDQWRWAKFPDQPLWQPIPDDRDQAFSRYDGLVPGLARPRAPYFQSYHADYPNMKGLTWNGREQDRQLLAGLERQAYKDAAVELQSRITDAVIDKAVRQQPPEYVELDAARLAKDLKGRRDKLARGAEAYYEHLAEKVEVRLSDAAERVEVERRGGDTRVRAWALGSDGNPAGEPVFDRTLHAKETAEVQVYLGGGDDRVQTTGKANDILVRVIGGAGQAVVDDTQGGDTRFSSDAGPGKLLAGPGSHVDGRKYEPPPPPQNAPWIPPRGWGRDTFSSPWLSYGTDLGLFVGVAVDTKGFGFRKDPYANRHTIRAGWAFGEQSFRADYRAEFRVENRRWYWGWYGYASGVDASRYFGFGNETSDARRSKQRLLQDQAQRVRVHALAGAPARERPHVLPRSDGSLRLQPGPGRRHAAQPGATLRLGDFGEVGATGILALDARDREKHPGSVALRNFGYPRHGAHVAVRGQVFPKAWDVEDTFGSVSGSAAVYLSPASERTPTLALRAGGQKLFGRYPYFEAAYLGGGLGGFGPCGGRRPGARAAAPPLRGRLEPLRERGSAHLRLALPARPAGDVGDPGVRRQRARVARGRGLEQVAHRLRRRALVRLARPRQRDQRNLRAQRGPQRRLRPRRVRLLMAFARRAFRA